MDLPAVKPLKDQTAKRPMGLLGGLDSSMMAMGQIWLGPERLDIHSPKVKHLAELSIRTNWALGQGLGLGAMAITLGLKALGQGQGFGTWTKVVGQGQWLGPGPEPCKALVQGPGWGWGWGHGPFHVVGQFLHGPIPFMGIFL